MTVLVSCDTAAFQLQLNWVWAVGVAYDQLLGTRCGSESHVTKKGRALNSAELGSRREGPDGWR